MKNIVLPEGSSEFTKFYASFMDIDPNDEKALLKRANKVIVGLAALCKEKGFAAEIDGVVYCKACDVKNRHVASCDKGWDEIEIDVMCCKSCFRIPADVFWQAVGEELHETIKKLKGTKRKYLNHVLRFMVEGEVDGKKSIIFLI